MAGCVSDSNCDLYKSTTSDCRMSGCHVVLCLYCKDQFSSDLGPSYTDYLWEHVNYSDRQPQVAITVTTLYSSCKYWHQEYMTECLTGEYKP